MPVATKKRATTWTPEFIVRAAQESLVLDLPDLPESEPEEVLTSVAALTSHGPNAARPEVFDNSPDVVEARLWLAGLIENPPTYQGKPIAFTVEITPARAIAILERNFKNRNPGEKNVRFLVRQIVNGKWRDNGQPIGLSTKESGGILLNGQHRMMAVIKSGKTIEISLRLGLDPEVQHTMDNNKPRTAADALWIKGMKDTNALAAACKLLARYLETAPEKPTLPAKPIKPMDYLSPEDHEEIAYRYPRLSEGTRKKVSFKAGQVTGASTVVFWTLANMHSQAKAQKFLDLFATGADMPVGHPILSARNYFIERMSTKKRVEDMKALTQDQRLSVLIKTFNAFAKGKSLKSLKAYNPEIGEPFPQILPPDQKAPGGTYDVPVELEA